MKKISKRLSNLKNNPFEEASEDHLSSLDEIIGRIEDTEEDISDDTHADGVDEDPDLLISELEDLEHHKGSADTDLSFTGKVNPPDGLGVSDILTRLGHIEDLPLLEEEDHLQEILSEHDSPENMILPDEDTQGDETESFISDESPTALTEEPESELELGRQMQPLGDDGTSMISVSSDKKDEDAESIWKDEMNSPPTGEIEMANQQEAKFSPELNQIGEELGTTTGEETLGKLQPLVNQALQIALEAAIPDMIHRVESALVPKISRQTEIIIAEQLPGIVDRIVSREIEKI